MKQFNVSEKNKDEATPAKKRCSIEGITITLGPDEQLLEETMSNRDSQSKTE